MLGYNYGAGQYRRVHQGIRFTTVLTVGYSVGVWAVVMLLPESLILPAVGFGADGVFLAEPISNVLGGLACILTMYFTVYRQLDRA